jgi:signal transduction histidine kinase
LEPRTAEALVNLYRECLAAEAPLSRTEVLQFPAGVRVCRVSTVPIRGPSGRITLLLGRAQDVTELRLMEAELSNLTERLLDAQEEERRRIAAELHDSTSQHLVAVQLELAALRRGRLTEKARADINNELAEAHREIRTLSYLLNPPRQADESLTNTLGGFAQGFARRTEMSIDLKVDGAINALPQRIQRALFRVTQEALANAHRHGRAKQVLIDLSLSGDGLRLAITDNGCPADLPFVRGVGISGMEVRIERFGGSLSVAPTPSGTAVVAVIPAAALNGGA